MRSILREVVARLLIITVSSTIVPKAQGAVIGSEPAINGDRERILMLLDRPEVAAQLEAYGIAPGDAKARVAALSDTEVVQLSAEMDEAYAGAGENPILYLMMAPVILLALPFLLVGAMIVDLITHKGKERSTPYQAPRVHQP